MEWWSGGFPSLLLMAQGAELLLVAFEALRALGEAGSI